MTRHTPTPILLGLLVLGASAALAGPPTATPYQGYLQESSGAPASGDVSVTVGIWDAPVGGARLYHESHPAVAVTQGLFNIRIGAGSVLEGAYNPATFEGSLRFLELTINGETLAPRRTFGAAPYAMAAGISDRQSLTGYFTTEQHEHVRTTSGEPVASSRLMTYTKKLDSSILKISYTDNLRVYNYAQSTGSAACQFHVYVDGQPCSVPAPITGGVYTARSDYTNPHRIRTMVGVCAATASGPLEAGDHEIRVYVENYYEGRDTGCYLGWESTATLVVEELP